jgi:hypothetical protein
MLARGKDVVTQTQESQLTCGLNRAPTAAYKVDESLSPAKIMPASTFLQPSTMVPQCGLYSHAWHCHPATPQFYRSPSSSPQAQIVKRHFSSSANLLESHVPPNNESQASAVAESLTFTSATKPSNPVLKGPAINFARNLSDSGSKDSDGLSYLPAIVAYCTDNIVRY